MLNSKSAAKLQRERKTSFSISIQECERASASKGMKPTRARYGKTSAMTDKLAIAQQLSCMLVLSLVFCMESCYDWIENPLTPKSFSRPYYDVIAVNTSR
jgi:hypothetical protein